MNTEEVKRIIDELAEEELWARTELFYAGLVTILCLHGNDKMGVKSLPEEHNQQGFLMWCAMLDKDELHNARSYFFDRWNFETNSNLDRTLLKILDGWENYRKSELHQSQ